MFCLDVLSSNLFRVWSQSEKMLTVIPIYLIRVFVGWEIDISTPYFSVKATAWWSSNLLCPMSLLSKLSLPFVFYINPALLFSTHHQYFKYFLLVLIWTRTLWAHKVSHFAWSWLLLLLPLNPFFRHNFHLFSTFGKWGTSCHVFIH